MEHVSSKRTLLAFMEEMNFEEIPVDTMNRQWPGSGAEPCRYFRYDYAHLKSAPLSFLGIVLLENLLDAAQPGEKLPIEAFRSLHDDTVTTPEGDTKNVATLELRHVDPTLDMYPETDFGFVIVGPTPDGDMVYTWHPGAPTSAPSFEASEILRGLPVKL